MNAYNLPLTQPQRARLERARDDGELNGVGSMYHVLRAEMGATAPNKNQISTFMRALPSVQINKTTKSVAGKKNVIGPMIPPPIPLGWCAADTGFIPACYNNVDKRVYKAIIVYICGLTKYLYVHPCSFGNADRPMSTTARDGFQEFIRRARIASNSPQLHPMTLKTDRGSEFAAGAFRTWMTAQNNQHQGFYAQKFTTNSRAAGNAWAERVLQSFRRLLYSHYRSIEEGWETNNTPAQQRVFNWVPVLDTITQRYNERRHNTIKARPIDAIAGNPAYQQTQQQIVESARQRYADHVVDRQQPGFSSDENRDLDIGDLVRTLIVKSGPGRATWNAKKSNKMSAGGNWSEELFVVARLRRANNNWGNSSYIIAELDQTQQNNIGDHKSGVYTRQQLLHCPPETLNYLSSSDDDNDDTSDDDEDDGQPVNAIAVDPRPLKPGDWRFKVGDVLLFRRDFFNAQPGGLNGLEAPPMRRDRTGIIRTRTRERARGANRGQYLYSVLFNDPATTVPRLPLDNDVDATFLAET